MATAKTRRQGPTSAPGQTVDHRALGAEALALRRAGRLDEALDHYRRAAEAAAACGNTAAQAEWLACQGRVQRKREAPEEARQAYEQAAALYASLGDAGLAGLADQEGNFGLLATERGDDFAAQFAYRRAVDLAQAAGDPGAQWLWGLNLGNALTRLRRYQAAWSAYGKALPHAGDVAHTVDTLTQWADSHACAYRMDLAAAQYRAAARVCRDPRRHADLALASMRASMRWGDWKGVELGGLGVLDAARRAGAAPALIDEIERMRAEARRSRSADAETAPADIDPQLLKPLDALIDMVMRHDGEAKDLADIARMGQLVCDIRWAIAWGGETGWQRFSTHHGLFYRVLGDAMHALCEAGRNEESLELSQRFKGAAFAVPALRAAEGSVSASVQVKAVLQALAELRQAADAFAAARPRELHALAFRVRAAGEALLEAGELLRDHDRDMHARLGGVVPPHQLVDALPSIDTVGIIDFVVTSRGLFAHIIGRRGADVFVQPVASSPDLTMRELAELAVLWGPDMVHAADRERQRDALDRIGQVLHDGFFCSLAHVLAEKLCIGQAIFVPDLLTRHLPLHLAKVCAKDLAIPGVAIDGAEYFCEVLPVEYAPCVQAVALSQHQRRPPDLGRIASFCDAGGDLPAARENGRWLGARIGQGIDYAAFSAEEVTRAAVEQELRRCGLVMLATHGRFDEQRPENSFLQLADHDWSALDMAALAPLERSPGVILAACEVSAADPGESPDAEGVPGALLSAGAAFVLGSRWPVEDVSMGYLIERFVHHLTHVGLRPAAVLFRAVRDLRRLGRADALARCRVLLAQMADHGTRERMPDAYARLDWFALQIEDGAKEQPFSDPLYWGGVTINGSGWNGMAGGVASDVMRVVELTLQLEGARSRVKSGRPAQASRELRQLLVHADGPLRAQALELLATATLQAAHPACRATALDEARFCLDEADFVARGEQREQLRRNIAATRAKLELMQGG